MEVNMTRRKMLLMTAGATVLGLAALIGFADHNAIFADDDDDKGQEALIKLLGTSKINLQQGLAAASEQQGQPISAKFEVDEGKLQLSVYTAKDGKFSEVLVDYTDGKVTKTEPITEGDDLAAAKSQSTAMAKAKTTLKEAVDKAAGSGNARVVSAVPSLKDGRPLVSIALLDGEKIKTVQQPLD